jgi:hypothetical protein
VSKRTQPRHARRPPPPPAAGPDGANAKRGDSHAATRARAIRGSEYQHSICYKDAYARGWAGYLAKTFLAAPEDRLWGTTSTDYLAGAPFATNGPEQTPPRANGSSPAHPRAAADVRLVAVMRDRWAASHPMSA